MTAPAVFFWHFFASKKKKKNVTFVFLCSFSSKSAVSPLSQLFFFFFFFFLISHVYVYIYKCFVAFLKIKKKKIVPFPLILLLIFLLIFLLQFRLEVARRPIRGLAGARVTHDASSSRFRAFCGAFDVAVVQLYYKTI